jgi:hypothetical protein
VLRFDSYILLTESIFSATWPAEITNDLQATEVKLVSGASFYQNLNDKAFCFINISKCG